jgi:peptidoglycan/xylan/chitin deacetylase (PgdA/CDA1 family)
LSALAITVDVDGEAGLGDGFGLRLSSRSERVYGVVRGLPRVLGVLEEFGAEATFYVPGVTALAYADEVREVLARDHELGHHGHTHARPDLLDAARQRAEIEDGLAALASLGAAVAGYRAPCWELTPVTLELLVEHGFRWDSSLMGDDRPYEVAGLVELPVHWSLDDAPYFPGDVRVLEHAWRSELAVAAAEVRPLTLTLHPEILGRAYRIDALRRVLEDAARLGVTTTTHAALAASVVSRRG